MTFRVTHRLPLPPVARPIAAPVLLPIEAECRACEWFQASVSRCVHPRNGCPRGEHRMFPWQGRPTTFGFPAKCPEK